MIPSTTATLKLANFDVTFSTPDGPVHAVRDVNLEIAKGECLGVVGESGSGKTQTFLAAFGLAAQNATVAGKALFYGQDIAHADRKTLNQIRGKRVSMIFQDPLTALNPVFKVGSQIAEVIRVHEKMPRAKAKERAVGLLAEVGIPNPRGRAKEYPHQFSGGMRQRAMIAMALALDPVLLLADEPTGNLDSHTGGEILDLLNSLRTEKQMTLVIATHDPKVAAAAPRVIVLVDGLVQS